MVLYQYSIVRCLPEPRTGEFMNVAAVAGDPVTGDWTVRQLTNERRVRAFLPPPILAAVHGFLDEIQRSIDTQASLFEQNGTDLLPSDWLNSLHYDHRNVVQTSAPLPVLAETADEALDVIFARMIVDPAVRERDTVSKRRVFSELLNAYRQALPANYIMPRSEIVVGDDVRTNVDFAIANGKAVQLGQVWSFQRETVRDTGEQVKAWGYIVNRLRQGDDARIVGGNDRVAELDGPSIDIEVVVAPPKTFEQERVFRESTKIFEQVGAQIHELGDADSVSDKAKTLIGN